METEEHNCSNLTEKTSSSSDLSTPRQSCTEIIVATPDVITCFSPNGAKLWLPNCSNDLKPVEGTKFKHYYEAHEFYKAYACAAGFNTRLSTSRKKKDVLKEQFFVCNKEGYTNTKKNETSSGKTSRKRTQTRVGCNAKMIIKLCDDGMYEVTKFTEEHNHVLYTPGCKQYQKEGRNMNLLHKKMVVNNAKMNVGPLRTYRQAKELYGGYENIGASKVDFKNFQRDLKAYITNSDAQMFVDIFTKKQKLWSALFFEFEVDENGRLCRALWADPICRKNYALYGDMVSFDTTYSTNRYNMIFGPFTGVDNHKKCITFAACFVANEDIQSFEWVFRTFVKAMDNKNPTCLITDQDPAMIIAIKNVLPKTDHRFCMWHIMKKMSDKIGRHIMQETDFITKINSCVWSVELEPEEFEEKWNEIMMEFDLQEHGWLNHMYEIRSTWIPAYFRDSFLTGLMRTTSRSESENHFFTSFTKSHLTLVEFLLRFEGAMEAQRHTQGKNDNDAKHSKPVCKTHIPIEKHGSEVFTPTVFYEFQKQVTQALYNCGVDDIQKYNEICRITVREKNKTTYQVVYNADSSETTCSCKMYNRVGFPCRHMIFVWKDRMLDKIPEHYVLNRWKLLPQITLQNNVIQECARTLDKKRMLNNLWSEIHMSVSLAEGDEEDLNDLTTTINAFRTGLEAKKRKKTNNNSTKIQDIEMLVGTTRPSEVVVKEPKVSKNKGTGVHITNSEKRLKGEKEKAVEQKQKKQRMCKGCHQLCNHDIRNCPEKPKK